MGILVASNRKEASMTLGNVEVDLGSHQGRLGNLGKRRVVSKQDSVDFD